MSTFGWLQPPVAPVTAAKAIPAAVTWGLKGQSLPAYPRTAMDIPPSTYRSVISLAEERLRQTGIPWRPEQLRAELSSRQYQFQRRSEFGTAIRTERELGIEASPLPPPAVAGLDWKSKAPLIGIAMLGGLVIFLVYRSEKGKGR